MGQLIAIVIYILMYKHNVNILYYIFYPSKSQVGTLNLSIPNADTIFQFETSNINKSLYKLVITIYDIQ